MSKNLAGQYVLIRVSNRSTLFFGVSDGADGVSVVATDVEFEYDKKPRAMTRTFIECTFRLFWQVHSRLSMVTSMLVRADTRRAGPLGITGGGSE
jgi:hypothetical protein